MVLTKLLKFTGYKGRRIKRMYIGRDRVIVFSLAILAGVAAISWKILYLKFGYYRYGYIGDLLVHPEYLDEYFAPLIGRLEYPVLIGVLIMLFALVANSLTGFFIAISTSAIVILMLIAYILMKDDAKAEDILKFLILAPSTIAYLNYNWDIFASMTVVLAVFLLNIGREEESSFVLGIGASIKVFPALLMPLILIKSKRKIRVATSFIASYLSINIPLMIMNFDGWWFPFKFNIDRPPNTDSFWYIVMNKTGVSPIILNVLMGVTYFLTLVHFLRKNLMNIYAHSFYLLSIFIFFGKVYSPQYNLWILPLLPKVKEKNYLGFIVFDVCNSIIGFLFWFLYEHIQLMYLIVAIRQTAFAYIILRGIK